MEGGENIKTHRLSTKLLYLVFLLCFMAKPLELLLRYYTNAPDTPIGTILILALLVFYMITVLFDKVCFKHFSIDYFIGVLLLVWTLIVQLVVLPKILTHSYNLLQHVIVATAFYAPLMYLLGTYMSVFRDIFRSNRGLRLLTILLYALSVGMFAYGIVRNFAQGGTTWQIHIDPKLQPMVSYLAFADTFAISTLIMLSWAKANITRVLLALLGALVLIAGFSRAAFILYCVTVILLSIISLLRKHNKAIKKSAVFLLIAGLVLVLGISTGTVQRFLFSVQQSRALSLIVAEPESDGSYIGRANLFEIGWRDLTENVWLTGSYMREVRLFGTSGTYIHNWISFWVSYGIFPFIVFAYLSLKALWLATKAYFKTLYRNEIVCAFSLILFAVMSIISARSYIWYYMWFALSAALALRNPLELTSAKSSNSVEYVS